VTQATCTEVGAKYKVCGCGYEMRDSDVVSMKPHTYNEEDAIKIDSTFNDKGSITYHCSVCDTTYTDEIPVKAHYFINVKVYNDDGEPAHLANVVLKYEGEIYSYYPDGIETDNGVASFKVEKDLDKTKWEVVITSTEIAGGAGGVITKTAKTDNKNYNEFNKSDVSDEDTTPEAPKPEEPDNNKCKCTCHKNTFWAMFFRFFHKIIEFFGGKPCCDDPRR
jgi:hypothetical protein